MVAVAILLPFLPLAANSLGWIFTEMGRQPWIVWGLMTTPLGVSPSNPWYAVAITLVGFTRRLRGPGDRGGGPAAPPDPGWASRRRTRRPASTGEGEPSLALGY